jgi:hypothetical protein
MQPSQDLEPIYEKYSPALYNIALRISITQTDAEWLLIKTFKEISHQKLFLQSENLMCFIRVLLKIANNHSNHDIYKCELFMRNLSAENQIEREIICQ